MENKELRLIITRLIRSSTDGTFPSLNLDPAGEDFSHARDFEVGDDPRRIEALPTAQRDRITVYERNIEVGANIYFMIDGSASQLLDSNGTPKLNYSINLVETISRACLGEGNRFCLMLFTDHNEYESGLINSNAGLEEKLDELKRCRPKSKTTDLKNSLKDFCLNFQDLQFGKPSILFILSDFVFEPDFMSELRQLNEQTDVVAIIVRDPAELNLPRPRFGLVRLADPETGKTFIARKQTNPIDKVVPILKRCGVDWMIANTGQEIGESLNNLAELFEKKEEG